MAETALTTSILPTAAEILAPSPGALLRRRVFRHWGLLTSALILGRHPGDGALGTPAGPV